MTHATLESGLENCGLLQNDTGHPLPSARLDPVEGATAVHLVAAHSLPQHSMNKLNSALEWRFGIFPAA